MIFEPWIQVGQIAFGRRIVHEMCYDGMLKIYRLNTADSALNELIEEEWFLDFYLETPKGLLLRSLASAEHWPITKLKHLDMERKILSDIVDVESSYLDWPVKPMSPTKAIIQTRTSRSGALSTAIEN